MMIFFLPVVLWCSIVNQISGRSSERIRDPVMRQFLFEVSKVLHDSIDSLSGEDDCRQITYTVKHFVQLVYAFEAFIYSFIVLFVLSFYILTCFVCRSILEVIWSNIYLF
jgi:hypothetical protein